MSAAVEDLAVYIESNTALTQGTDLFINFMPDSPDEVVGLYSTAGRSDGGQLMGGDGKNTFEVVGIEILSRAGAHDFPTANTNAEAVRDAIQQIVNETVNGTYYLRVQEDFTIHFDGTDVQDRTYLRNTFSVFKYL